MLEPLLSEIESWLLAAVAAACIAAAIVAPFYCLATLERGMWSPDACPLCAAGVPLVDRVPTA